MNRLLLLLSLLFIQLGYAQTTLNGTANGYERWTIRLITYEDYFTYREKVLAETRVDSSGKFELNYEGVETKFCLLKIGKTLGGIYLQPDTKYSIDFPQVDSIAIKYMEKESYVTLDIKSDQGIDLSKLTRRFDEEYGRFTADNIVALVSKSARTKVDTFAINRQRAYADIESQYLQKYIEYNLARLRFSAYTSKKVLYGDYLKNKPIRYANDAYMEFVNIFYQDYFKTLPLGNYDKLLEAISIKMDRLEIQKLMHNPEILGNDTLAELVLIRSLYENFHNPDLTKKSILFVLKDIQKSTVIAEHKQIVTSVLKKLSGVEKGSYAPDFQLVDIEGNEVMLSDYYKDKYVYIDFWATWCKPCVREMKLTPELHKKYGRDVEIVSISIDKKHRSMRRFAEKNKYKWTFLHYDGNEELKEAYKVNAIPLYYLIAPGGKVIYSPAPRPSKIEAKFEKIKAQGKPRRKAYELISD